MGISRKVVALLVAAIITISNAVGGGFAGYASVAPTVFAYVGQNDGIAVIDTSTDEIVHLIGLGPSAFVSDVSVSPGGNRVYATLIAPDGAPGSLAVIDTATNVVIARIQVGVEPHGIAASRDGSRVYVAVNGGGNPPMGVWIIDTATNTVVDVIDLEALPSALGLSGDDSCLFVGHLGGRFSVLHPATRTIISTFVVEGAGIDSLTLSSQAPVAFVANGSGAGGGVARVNVASHRLLDVPLSGHNVQVVALRPGTDELWATATEEGFFVLDSQTGSVLAHVEVPGANLVGIDFTPDGRKAYLVNGGTPSVLVIDAATREETRRIATPTTGYSKGHFITFPASVARAADASCRPIRA